MIWRCKEIGADWGDRVAAEAYYVVSLGEGLEESPNRVAGTSVEIVR